MNWYIGQEVVCVNSENTRMVVKDKVYRIKGLQTSPCKCGMIVIDVGAVSDARTQGCFKCGSCWSKTGPTIWLDETRFAPLMDISELESILKEETQTH